MQGLLHAERDKQRHGEVMLDGVAVLEMNAADLEDFSESQLADDDALSPSDKLLQVRRELSELRDLLSAPF